MAIKDIRLTKEGILESTDGGYDFFEYVIPELKLSTQSKCENVLNPFYDDSNPGLSIYLNEKTGRWQFYDHGDSPSGEKYKGDVFDFAAHYYQLDVKRDFTKILYRIAEDLNLDHSKYIKPELSKLETKSQGETVDDEPYDFDYWYRGDAEDRNVSLMGYELFYTGPEKGIAESFNYFKQFGISEAVLKEYNVSSIDWAKRLNNEGEIRRIRSNHTSYYICAYEDIHFAKIYRPENDWVGKSFQYVGSKPKDFVFGMRQIHRRMYKKDIYREYLIITSGEKDVLTLASFGFDAICFNSETANVPITALENLFCFYKKVVVVYDIDETGISMSQKVTQILSTYCDVHNYILPDSLKKVNGKDISDYVASGLDIEVVKKEIEELVESTSNKELKLDNSLEVIQGSGGIETPCISNEIFENLPLTLKNLCAPFANARDRDLILLSSLTTISSFFPSVKGYYGGRKVGPNLFLFISAPASAGKGVMAFSRELGTEIQDLLKSEFKAKLARYESDLADYHARKFENPDKEKPEPPKPKFMFIPANVSVSMMIQLLDGNQDFGLIFETEGDTLSDSLRSEWGNFSDILRKAFHHEPISLARRKDNEFLEITKPHLSVVLSGTENQVVTLIKDVENGFFSRMLFYTFRSKAKWNDQFNSLDKNVGKVFDDASKLFLKYWQLQKGFETTFQFSKQQQVFITKFFSNKIIEFEKSHGDGIIPSIRRLGLIHFRIAMILSILRSIDEKNEIGELLIANETDFKTSVTIIHNLFPHLTAVYDRMESSLHSSKLNAKQRILYEKLPKEFDRKLIDKLSTDLGIKYKTAERYIGIYIQKDLIVRSEHGKYQKL